MITRDIQSIFCNSAICERLASMLNYFLQHLVCICVWHCQVRRNLSIVGWTKATKLKSTRFKWISIRSAKTCSESNGYLFKLCSTWRILCGSVYWWNVSRSVVIEVETKLGYSIGHIMNNCFHKQSKYWKELDIQVRELMHFWNWVNILK